jgi:hypothetical protein
VFPDFGLRRLPTNCVIKPSEDFDGPRLDLRLFHTDAAIVREL